MASISRVESSAATVRTRAAIEEQKAAREARAEERVRRIKYLSKAKAWLKGGPKLKGFERLKFTHERGWICFKDGKVPQTVLLDLNRYGEVSHVFRAKDGTGRLVIVRQSPSNLTTLNKLIIEATTFLPKEFRSRDEKQFLSAEVQIKKNRGKPIGFRAGLAWDGNFYPKTRINKSAGETTPPEFIKRMGFALFVDAVSTNYVARAGARKLFSLADLKGKGVESLEIRGFREPSEEERRQFDSTIHLRPGTRSNAVLMVRDLPVLESTRKVHRKE